MPKINALKASAASNTDLEFSVIEDLTIKLSGASDLDLNSDISNLNASVSGASDFNIEGNIIYSNIKMSGASEVDIEGEGDNLVLRLSGASTFYGREFELSSISLTASGASTAHINSTDKISIDASSASRIFHYGTGSIDDLDLSSAASFKSVPKKIHQH